MAAKEQRVETPANFLIVFNQGFADEVKRFKQRPYKTFVGEIFAKLASYFSAVNAINKKLLTLKPDQVIPVRLADGRVVNLTRGDVPKISGLFKLALGVAKKYIRTKKETAGRKTAPETEHKSVFARMMAGYAMLGYLQQAFGADEFGGLQAGQLANLQRGLMLKLTAMNLWYILGYVATARMWQGQRIPTAAEAKAQAAQMSYEQLTQAKTAYSGESFTPSQLLLQSFAARPATYTIANGVKTLNLGQDNLWTILQAQGNFANQRIKLNSINRIISLTMYSKGEDVPQELQESWKYLVNPGVSPVLIAEKNAVAAHRVAIKAGSAQLKKNLEAARKQYKNRHDELNPEKQKK